MARLLILGYGNPLRTDDGLGWRAAEALAAKFSGEDVEIKTCQQLLPEMADLVSKAESAIFIDAASDGEPGELRCARVEPDSAPTRFTHQLSPAAILASAQKLYGRCPQAYLVSVSGKSFALGDRLSPVVFASLPRLTELVGALARTLDCS